MDTDCEGRVVVSRMAAIFFFMYGDSEVETWMDNWG